MCTEFAVLALTVLRYHIHGPVVVHVDFLDEGKAVTHAKAAPLPGSETDALYLSDLRGRCVGFLYQYLSSILLR